MDIKINRKIYRDKVYACWLGKNIGGTMGAPYEGDPELQDIKGFSSPKGEPIPNDDLDLQLIWLFAAETVGFKQLNANILGWYWKRYIPAIWNEYGVGKNNLSLGLTPPLSGEYLNEGWKNSNGAWIRSEIWACLAPGFPNIATRYAAMDASVDHGVSEGSAAEIFVCALESIAFVESNIRTLIEKALSFIPETTRVAKSVRTVMEEYDKKTPWKKVREMIIENNKDLGCFQAPANIGFVTIGLLYGEGDFLSSLIHAINCGDDTDCTGATVGSILGIIGGTAAIPKELSDYIGDRIITVALDVSAIPHLIPHTCTELTEKIMRNMPAMFNAQKIYAEYTDDETAPFSDANNLDCDWSSIGFLSQKPYTAMTENHWLTGTLTFENEPRITPEGSISFELKIKNRSYNLYQLSVEVMTPEGWSADYPRSVSLHHLTHARLTGGGRKRNTNDEEKINITLNAGTNIQAVNRVYIAIWAQGYPTPLIVPVTLLG